MSFLKRVFGRGCSHRFTWPRLSKNGRHYQVCLSCGIAYEYDWDRMRRTSRLLVTAEQHVLNFARTGWPGASNWRGIIGQSLSIGSCEAGPLP